MLEPGGLSAGICSAALFGSCELNLEMYLTLEAPQSLPPLPMAGCLASLASPATNKKRRSLCK